MVIIHIRFLPASSFYFVPIVAKTSIYKTSIFLSISLSSIRPKNHFKCFRIVNAPLTAPYSSQSFDVFSRPRMRIRSHHPPIHRQSLDFSIHTLLAYLNITIRHKILHGIINIPLRTRWYLHVPVSGEAPYSSRYWGMFPQIQ